MPWLLSTLVYVLTYVFFSFLSLPFFLFLPFSFSCPLYFSFLFLNFFFWYSSYWIVEINEMVGTHLDTGLCLQRCPDYYPSLFWDDVLDQSVHFILQTVISHPSAAFPGCPSPNLRTLMDRQGLFFSSPCSPSSHSVLGLFWGMCVGVVYIGDAGRERCKNPKNLFCFTCNWSCVVVISWLPPSGLGYFLCGWALY